MTANNRDAKRVCISANQFGNKGRSPDDVQGRDTKDSGGWFLESALKKKYNPKKRRQIPSWIVNIVLLEYLGDDGDSGVDRVRDDAHERLGCVFGSSRGKVTDDACIDIEQVITGHARLSWNTGRDDD